VWLDDQIGPDDLDFVERRRQVAPIEAFVPKSREGVDEDTVAAIAAFLERHRSQSV